MSEFPSPPQPRYTWPIALAIFAVATVGLNLRTVRDLDSQRPFPRETLTEHGHALVCNDTAAFSDHIEQFANRAKESPSAIFRRDVYFPVPEFDCPVSFLLPCGLLKWATDWPSVRIINLFTLVVIFLNAVAACGFLRTIGVSAPAAVAAATTYMCPNFVLYAQHMGHMNYVQLQWIAFAFWGLAATLRPGAGWRPAVGLGLAMGFQLLSSPSFSLYLAYVGLPVFVLAYWLTPSPTGRPKLIPLALRGFVAVAIALVVSAPALIPRFALMPSTHHVPGPAFTWANFSNVIDPAHPTVYVGIPLLILGLLALIWLARARTPVGFAMLATLVVAAACMLPDDTGKPFWVLREYAPLFDRMRVPTRFFPIAFLMLLGLVASAMTWAEGKRLWVGWIFATVLLTLAVSQLFISSWHCGEMLR